MQTKNEWTDSFVNVLSSLPKRNKNLEIDKRSLGRIRDCSYLDHACSVKDLIA